MSLLKPFGGFAARRGDALGEHVRVVPPSLKFGRVIRSKEGYNRPVTGYAVPGGFTKVMLHYPLNEADPDQRELLFAVDPPEALPPARADSERGVREVQVPFFPFPSTTGSLPLIRIPPGGTLYEEMLGETAIVTASIGNEAPLEYLFELTLWGHHTEDSGNESVKNVLAWWR